MQDISNSINKVDNDAKISGRAKYINDYYHEDHLFAYTVRSNQSKALIKKITMPKLPTGYYTVDHTDVPGENYVSIIYDDMPVFATHKVEYYQEPIMLLVGPDKAVIKQLIKQIHIEYEPLQPTFDYVNSAIHYAFGKGHIEQAFNEADRVIKYTYDTGYQEQLYIEPQGMLGYLEDEKVTLIGSIQCPYYVKNAVLNTLGCEDHLVRVKQSVVGGAFGGKEEFPSLIACQLAVAIQKIKKPIKLIYDREEDMEATTKRHPSKITLEAAIKSNDIIGIKSSVGIDAGAYLGLSGVVLSRALIATTGAYTIDNVDVNGDVYVTNTVPNGAFRGFGAPQMFFAIEMFMHHVAKDLGVDPLPFRKKYLAKQHDHTSTSGLYRDPIIMEEMITKALQISDYNNKVKAYEDETVYKGIGMSWFLHGCGFTGSGESTHIKARVQLKKDRSNKVYVLIAAVDMGQGVKTTMKKIVSNVLNISIDDVIYDNPDTDYVPDSGPTVASRTTMIVGGLVARAAKALKDQWEDGKSQLVEEHYQQPQYIKWDEDTFTGDAYPAYSWGVNIVEVEVSKISYQVNVLHSWSVYDVGKAIDDRIVLGQADGGHLQGIGLGYLEKMNHKAGKILQKNVTDYVIPTSVDTPTMKTVIMDNPYPLGPYGAKGAGELTLIGGAPAVALAIEQAINRKVFSIPVTPEKIMEMIHHGKH